MAGELKDHEMSQADLDKALEEISKALETMSKTLDAQSRHPVEEKKPSKTKTKEPEEKLVVSPKLPGTIDNLMEGLVKLVKPQTEAKQMAESLESVRDELTTMIKGHTPVLFQFGKRARELKSYPPTATLNENDIARLSKELRDWKSKLKAIAKGS